MGSVLNGIEPHGGKVDFSMYAVENFSVWV